MTFNVINHFTISCITIENIFKTLKFTKRSVKKEEVIDKNEKNQKTSNDEILTCLQHVPRYSHLNLGILPTIPLMV
jgi:hypothetical protein